MNQLANELKVEIIKALNLEGVSPDDIENDAPLFGEGLGLDSIDALELIVLLDKNYGIKIDSAADGKTVFQSIASMVAYIESKK
jgi:acyl carrier protein